MAAFKCPACGAPLDYAGGEETTVRCPYCANVVAVPAELRSVPLAPVVVIAPPAPAPAAPPVLHASLHEARHARRVARRMARRLGRPG